MPEQIPQLALTISWCRLSCYKAPPSQSSPNSTTFICLPWPLFSGEEDYLDAAIVIHYLYLPRCHFHFHFSIPTKSDKTEYWPTSKNLVLSPALLLNDVVLGMSFYLFRPKLSYLENRDYQLD